MGIIQAIWQAYHKTHKILSEWEIKNNAHKNEMLIEF